MSLKEKLLKFLSVKVYVFTILAILTYLGKDTQDLMVIALAFYGARSLQYYLQARFSGGETR